MAYQHIPLLQQYLFQASPHKNSHFLCPQNPVTRRNATKGRYSRRNREANSSPRARSLSEYPIWLRAACFSTGLCPPASPSLPVEKTLAFGPTTGFSDTRLDIQSERLMGLRPSRVWVKGCFWAQTVGKKGEFLDMG
jgi:hypothetical protein